MIYDLSHVPKKAGVYKFFDDKEIIYIGKSKDLNKRVRSYFTDSLKDRKTEQIKRLAIKVETFATHSEAEALLLEQQLIKEYKPKFNILLRDDKTYPYIYFNENNEFPSILLKRSKNAIDDNFFGPFTSAKFAKSQIKSLQKIFKLRNCSDSTFKNRSRPCIEYQMNQCSAPCVNFISKINYNEDIQKAKAFLTSEKSQLKKIFLKKMHVHVKKLEFEEADTYKRQIAALEILEDESNMSLHKITLDIIHFSIHESQIGAAILAVREGKIQSTKTYYFSDIKIEYFEELLHRLVFHYYQSSNQLPNKILILNKIKTSLLISEAFYKKFNKTVKITNRVTKKFASFAALAKLNSRQVVENFSTRMPIYKEHFEDLSNFLKLHQDKITLEALDISHHSGAHAKAAIIHLDQNGFIKSKYRTYNIPKILSGNDTGSIKFSVEKRLDSKNSSPSVLLIDGGERQLKAALSAKNHKRTIVLAIKKGSRRKLLTETIYSEDGQESIRASSKLFMLLVKARDEAHRFALNANRKAKEKSITLSKLDTIKGIGPHKKNILLKKFKSVNAIFNASSEDLLKVKGINLLSIKAIKGIK